ncbi:MAG: FtsK/SpoIIIE domain-containing protein [Acidimicrobiales bacterium]
MPTKARRPVKTKEAEIAQVWAILAGLFFLGTLAAEAAGFPFGVPAYLALACACGAFGKPEDYPQDGPLERRAHLARLLRHNLVSPRVSQLGPGPSAGKAWPPTRMSTGVAVLVAGLVAAIPSGAPLVSGVLAFFAAQAVAATVRAAKAPYVPKGEGEPQAPEKAVMVDVDLAKILAADPAAWTGVVAGALAGVAADWGLHRAATALSSFHPHLPVILATRLPTAWLTPTHDAWLAGCAGALVAAAVVVPRAAAVVLAPDRELRAKRKDWAKRWQQVLRTEPIPWLESEQATGMHATATFAVTPGGAASAYLGLGPKLAGVLGTDQILVSPVPLADDYLQGVKGTRSHTAFTVTWSLVPLGPDAHIHPELEPETFEFVLSAKVKDAFSSLKLGAPELVEARTLTKPGSPPLFASRWKLSPEVTYEDVVRKAHALDDKLGVFYARVGRRQIEGQEALVLVHGSSPDTVNLREPAPPIRGLLAGLDWEAAFRACKLTGIGGATPRFVGAHPGAQELLVSEFAPIEGLSTESIVKAQPELVSTLGRNYVAVEPTAGTPGGFQVVTGHSDPLDRTYLFSDYLDDVLKPAEGVDDMTVVLGVGPDGSLITYDFEAAEPHLVVAGSTGMGKSVCLHSILIQLIAKHGPDQLEIWMADPKTELHRYQDIAHVRRFIDITSPGEHPANQVVETIQAAKDEMDRRITLFKNLPGGPQKLSEVRQGIRQGRYELDEAFPYVIMVIDECADYFEEPKPLPDKDANDQLKANSKRVNALIEMLSRKARSSGIYLVLATQRPTKATIPVNVKSNSRRIGFGVKDGMSSMVIIDQPGLEDIRTPGRGLAPTLFGYRPFRSLFLPPADLAAQIEALPHDKVSVAG